MKHLKRRKTNVVAFELLAGIMGVLQMQDLRLENVGVRHFVDSNPARQCMVKTCSGSQLEKYYDDITVSMCRLSRI